MITDTFAIQDMKESHNHLSFLPALNPSGCSCPSYGDRILSPWILSSSDKVLFNWCHCIRFGRTAFNFITIIYIIEQDMKKSRCGTA